MLRIFSVILGMSFTGSMLLLLFLFLSPLFRRRFHAKWYRRALCALLFFFVVPIGMLIRSIMGCMLTDQTMAALTFMGDVPAPLANVFFPQEVREPVAPSGMPVNLLKFFAAVWFCVAIVLLVRKMLHLLYFQRHLKRSVFPIEDDVILLIYQQVLLALDLQKHMRLYRSRCTTTPMITGMIRPMVILPDIEPA